MRVASRERITVAEIQGENFRQGISELAASQRQLTQERAENVRPKRRQARADRSGSHTGAGTASIE